jgi:HNH endonuclease
MATDPDEEPILWSVWDRADLQRCHLIPRALGGPDSPSNLVLLCWRCHIEGPDVGAPEYMLRWIGAHEHWGVLLCREIESAVRLAGLTDDQIGAFNEQFLSRGLYAVRSALADWAVPVANRFSYATLAACAVEAVVRTSPDPDVRPGPDRLGRAD